MDDPYTGMAARYPTARPARPWPGPPRRRGMRGSASR